MGKIKQSALITHAIGWLLFLCLPLLFIAGQNSNEVASGLITSPFYWLFFLCYAIIFYTHTWLLLPDWFYKKKYMLYGAAVIILFLLVYFIKPFDNLMGLTGGRHPMRSPPPFGDYPPEHPRGPGRPPRGFHLDIISIALFLLTIALSFAVVASKNLRVTQQRALHAEKEKAIAELSILKAQINPHFLFNTLNNLYSLAISDQPNTATGILKLSNILRYVTEEVTNAFVPLKAEIDCINDYIDLQRLRLSKKTTVNLNITGNTSNIQIAPMILMTFIENAFKFGVSAHQSSEINIGITTKEKTILFTCSNTLNNKATNPERTGVGLINTRKRLDYIYEHHYELDINTDNNLYTVTLTINT